MRPFGPAVLSPWVRVRAIYLKCDDIGAESDPIH